MNREKGHQGGEDQEQSQRQASIGAASRDIRREFLTRGIEIFRLGQSFRELGRKGASPDEVQAVRSELAEHVHKVSQQRGKSLHELNLKTQILCVLMDSDMLDLCPVLARSIRDDTGFLCQRNAKGSRRQG